jgi:hypothetical protein
VNSVGLGETSRWLMKLNAMAKNNGRMMNIAIRNAAGPVISQPVRFDCRNFDAMAVSLCKGLRDRGKGGTKMPYRD